MEFRSVSSSIHVMFLRVPEKQKKKKKKKKILRLYPIVSHLTLMKLGGR